MEATDVIVQALTDQVTREELVDADALYESLQNELRKLLVPVDQPMQIDGSKKPYVILMVGVNGVGKTTTIGKLACRFKAEGKSGMLAAGDTFRAAAVEQLQVWGERNDIPVVAQHTGADSASVVYDAVAVVMGEDSGKRYAEDKPSIDFVNDAFAHAKFVAYVPAVQPLFEKAGVWSRRDDGFFDVSSGKDAAASFIETCGKLRFWARESGKQD